MRRSIAVVAIVVAGQAFGWTVGCGGSNGGDDDGDEQAAVAAVAAIQRAFAGEDLAFVCDRMTPAARAQAAAFAHGRRDGCERDLREAFAIAQPEHVRGTRPPPPLTGATVDGEQATVIADGPNGRFGVPLVERDGQWRLASFFGMAEEIVRGAAATQPRDALAHPPRGERVTVIDARGLACFPVLTDLFPDLDGGCEVAVRGRGVRLVFDTAFGRYDFGRCTISYRLRLDDRGRAWATDVAFSSPGINDGCADVNPCMAEDGVRYPWPARVRAAAGGGLRNDLEVCLYTCAGMYAGRLTLPLDGSDRNRRPRSSGGEGGAAAGTSGFNVYGGVRLAPTAVRIEPVA